MPYQQRTRLYPQNIHTEQLVKRRYRRDVTSWIEQELNPERTGQSESDSSEQSTF
ncbi:hypothetical protein QC823_06715 [Halomonas vilamensis]|uniref:Uncharacterized protein n=1 Tax=Vreelandella vilamensis TaxID=531309 RepID=A0ABU1H4U9_9GAMM|nr:hypothetical protein [Halomonas vilamensis]MDR5898677.1 hypothetical protein [Halomonas vilamensis]